MAKPFTQFMDRRGEIHSTPEAAISADLVILTGVNPVMARQVVDNRGTIETLFKELETILIAYSADLERQEIDRRACKRTRPVVSTEGPAARPAETEE